MVKSRDRSNNGSYLYKLNEELSGQAELSPYFEANALADQELTTGGAAEEEAIAGEADDTAAMNHDEELS